MNKILITGASGFIGSHLASYLKSKNYNIYLTDNKQIKNKKIILNNKKISFFKFDLNKKIKKKLTGFTHIFHLAASLGVKNITKNPYNTFKNNIYSLSNLVDNIKLNSPNCTFIFFSSSEVYSPLIKKSIKFLPTRPDVDLLINEETINRDSYYLSKIIGEKIIKLSGLNHVILRPHNVYGPEMGFRHVISELIIKNKKNNCKVYSPNHTRSFCYIDDAINQIYKISFNRKCLNKVFNIGNPYGEITMFNLAKKIKKIMKSKTKLISGPVTKGSPSRRYPSISKNLKFVKLDKFTKIDQGIIKTLKWVQEK